MKIANNTLLTNTWTVTNRDLKLSDILNLVSQDIDNTYLIRNNLSDRIIGYIEYSVSWFRIGLKLNEIMLDSVKNKIKMQLR